jgi:N-acetylmuramoyl-L-alanine amidase
MRFQASLQRKGLRFLVGGLLVFGGFFLAVSQSGLQQRQLVVGRASVPAVALNNVLFAPLEYATELGLDVQVSDDWVTLFQGGRVLRYGLDDSLSDAVSQWTNGLTINGLRQRSPAAGRSSGKIYVPVRTLADAVGASFEESGANITINVPQAKLGTVSSDKDTRSDRIVLETDRDVGFGSRLEKDELIVTLRSTTGDATPYQVGGQFVDVFEVKPSGNKLEVRVPLKKEYGYSVFAISSAKGVPARTVIDVGPRFERPKVALESRPALVVLDPGHGGADTGVTVGNLREKDIALSLSRRIAAVLTSQGVTVRFTREQDINPAVSARQELSLKSAVFVSLHVSNLPGTTAKGVQIYYISPDSRSEGILQEGRNALEETKSERDKRLLSRFLSPRASSQRLADRISAQLLALPESTVQVSSVFSHVSLKRAPKAAVLLELGYLSNKEDVTRLTDADQSVETAISVSNGILEYLGRKVVAKPKPATTPGTMPTGAPR